MIKYVGYCFLFIIVSALAYIYDGFSSNFFNIGAPLIAAAGFLVWKKELRGKRQYDAACDLLDAYEAQSKNIQMYLYHYDHYMLGQRGTFEEFLPELQRSTDSFRRIINKASLVFYEDKEPNEIAKELCNFGDYYLALGKHRNTLEGDVIIQASEFMELDFDERNEKLRHKVESLRKSLKKYV